MKRHTSRDRYLNRKKKMKRRRVFWTFLFVVIAVLLAYKAVSFGKEKLFNQVEVTAKPVAVSSGKIAQQKYPVAKIQNLR